MIQPLDPFALEFDSIEIDPTRAPTPEAIDSALAMCAPSAAAPETEAPGYYLLDDAHGRFEVDRLTGVVRVKDENLLLYERGMVHAVRLRAVEASGASYELDVRLRLTGRVPQVVGAEEFDFIAALAAKPIPGLEPPPRRVAWSMFAPALGAQAKPALAEEASPFGALFETPLPPAAPVAALALPEFPPAPASARAWSNA